MRGAGPPPPRAPIGSRRDVGEGTKRDPRGVSAPDRERSARQTDKPEGVSLASLSVCPSTPHPLPTLPFLFSLLVEMPGRLGDPSMHGPGTRAHTDPHQQGRTWLQSPIPFPAETPSPLHNLTDTPPFRARWMGGCLEGGSLLPPPPCPHPSSLTLFRVFFWRGWGGRRPKG